MIFLNIESNLVYILKTYFSPRIISSEILHSEIKFWLLQREINPFIVVNGYSKDTSLPKYMTGNLEDLFEPCCIRQGLSISPIISTTWDMVRVLEQDNYFGFDKEEDALLFKLTWL